MSELLLKIPEEDWDDESLYPESDDEPLGETDFHIVVILHLLAVLGERYREREDVYVAADTFIYYERGNRAACVSPDAYVVFGAENRLRRSYFTWKEGHLPAVVFEIASRNTISGDRIDKLDVYNRRLPVEEYFLFDPLGEYLKPRLQGYRRIDGELTRLELVDGQLVSEQLRVRLVPDGKRLELFDLDTGELLRDLAQEAEARRRAERRIAELEAELARLRRQSDSSGERRN